MRLFEMNKNRQNSLPADQLCKKCCKKFFMQKEIYVSQKFRFIQRKECLREGIKKVVKKFSFLSLSQSNM